MQIVPTLSRGEFQLINGDHPISGHKFVGHKVELKQKWFIRIEVGSIAVINSVYKVFGKIADDNIGSKMKDPNTSVIPFCTLPRLPRSLLFLLMAFVVDLSAIFSAFNFVFGSHLFYETLHPKVSQASQFIFTSAMAINKYFARRGRDWSENRLFLIAHYLSDPYFKTITVS